MPIEFGQRCNPNSHDRDGMNGFKLTVIFSPWNNSLRVCYSGPMGCLRACTYLYWRLAFLCYTKYIKKKQLTYWRKSVAGCSLIKITLNQILCGVAFSNRNNIVIISSTMYWIKWEGFLGSHYFPSVHWFMSKWRQTNFASKKIYIELNGFGA